MADCKKYRFCYPLTAEYYKRLFDNQNVEMTRRDTSTSNRFKKVAEFTAYPELKIGDWKFQIKDDKADESFTVYDHPKIMIFKKLRS